jgi:glycosyltransferase 2 family protein
VKNKISTYSGVIIPVLLGAGLTFYIYNSFTPEQLEKMKGYFITANYKYVTISLFVAFLGYVLRAYRWKYTLAEIGSHPGFKINFLAVSIGYFVNLGIPRSGEVSRALILKKYREIPFDKAFGTIIAERIVDFIILLILIITSVIIEFTTLKKFLLTYIPIKVLIIISIVGFIGFIGSLYFYKYSKWKYILLIKSKIEGLKEGALSVFNMPNKMPFIFYTLLIWISYILMFYLSIYSINATSSMSLGTTIVAFVIGGLVMTFTNGGFGFFPFLIAKILLLYGIPLEAGTAFGWIIWTSQILITIVLGIFSFLVLPLVAQKK